MGGESKGCEKWLRLWTETQAALKQFAKGSDRGCEEKNGKTELQLPKETSKGTSLVANAKFKMPLRHPNRNAKQVVGQVLSGVQRQCPGYRWEL